MKKNRLLQLKNKLSSASLKKTLSRLDPFGLHYGVFFLALLFSFGSSCQVKRNQKRSDLAELHLNIPYDPYTLDPRKGGDLTSSTMQFLLFEGLTRMTPYSTVSLGMAEKIDISEDKKTYTFYLRKAYWSNGVPVTAFDFAQTWKDMLNPNFSCPNAHLLYPIKNAEAAKRGLVLERQIGIRALDYQTLEVYLEEPTPFFLEMLSFCVYFPIYQNVATRIAKWAECTGQDFICNGPYRLVEWRRNNEIILEKNPYYWDKEHVELDRISISIMDNEATALQMFERDELDVLGLPFTGIPSDAVPSLRDKGLIKTTSLPASTICCFNMHAFPFTNVNIRKAFAYAINRQELVENITHMNEEIGPSFIPKSLNGYDLPPFFKDGDVETARIFLRKGLRELNLKEEDLDNAITLLHASSGVYPKIAEALQNQWQKALGIRVKLARHDYRVFIDKLTKRNYQMAECAWIAQYGDPMNFFERLKIKSHNKNYPAYENPQYVELLEKSSQYIDSQKRFTILQEAERLIADEMPLTTLYHWRTPYLQKPHVENLVFSNSGRFLLQQIHLQKMGAKEVRDE
ncbi:MAG: peptide ABC transporter substrate-binding protein [Verrucomicrobia bacterium]|nr:peptide ABC transporter substrate-binding protein [Verrucomicrobiota bacterium]